MFRRNYERQVVRVNHSRDDSIVFRVEAQDSQLQVAIDQFGGDPARQAAADLDRDARILAPVSLNMIKKIQRRRLIRPND